MNCAAVTLSHATRAIGEGSAVVLPNPAPLTHVVTATRARAVNEAKGRPADQAVALWAHHPDTLAALHEVWELKPDAARLACRLLAEERLTVLVPVSPAASDRFGPAVKDGWMLLFGARWQPLRPLLDAHPVLYVSSANRTGGSPAATTAEALEMFPATVCVLELPRHQTESVTPGADRAAPRRATTTVRLHPDGLTELHRHGAQDAATGPEEYLESLRSRYAAPDRPTS
ncbi:hypothetical protein ACIPSE_33865 [Streptomyces sp. NPDC090106]|uniref:hypothetical protein n=1 Tax=Streptomyces sp. NPDC090106 TaxID=3365946 RepID=UPI0037F90778